MYTNTNLYFAYLQATPHKALRATACHRSHIVGVEEEGSVHCIVCFSGVREVTIAQAAGMQEAGQCVWLHIIILATDRHTQAHSESQRVRLITEK